MPAFCSSCKLGTSIFSSLNVMLHMCACVCVHIYMGPNVYVCMHIKREEARGRGREGGAERDRETERERDVHMRICMSLPELALMVREYTPKTLGLPHSIVIGQIDCCYTPDSRIHPRQ